MSSADRKRPGPPPPTGADRAARSSPARSSPSSPPTRKAAPASPRSRWHEAPPDGPLRLRTGVRPECPTRRIPAGALRFTEADADDPSAPYPTAARSHPDRPHPRRGVRRLEKRWPPLRFRHPARRTPQPPRHLHRRRSQRRRLRHRALLHPRPQEPDRGTPRPTRRRLQERSPTASRTRGAAQANRPTPRPACRPTRPNCAPRRSPSPPTKANSTPSKIAVKVLHQKIDTVVYEIESLAAQEAEAQTLKRDALAAPDSPNPNSARPKPRPRNASPASIGDIENPCSNATRPAPRSPKSRSRSPPRSSCLLRSLQQQQQPLEHRLQELEQLVDQRRTDMRVRLPRTQASGPGRGGNRRLAQPRSTASATSGSRSASRSRRPRSPARRPGERHPGTRGLPPRTAHPNSTTCQEQRGQHRGGTRPEADVASKTSASASSRSTS